MIDTLDQRGTRLKVFLDDERITPEGWVRTFWPEEVIALLKTGQVTDLSLDHDLGDDDHGTGYTVLLWLEEHVALHGMKPPKIRVHSANSSARVKMEAAISSINRLADTNSIRTPGAMKGKIEIAEDFDMPLPQDVQARFDGQ